MHPYRYSFWAVLLIMLQFTGIGNAQNINTATIKGRVLTVGGEPAEYINVQLLGTPKGAVTDEDGVFIIKYVTPGDYTLEVSYIGLETRQVNLGATAGETLVLPDITLTENLLELQELIITAERLNQFSQKETEHVARLPLPNLENPQSYTVVTSALMDEQIATDLPSSLKSITGGGYVQTNEGNVSAYLRGFRSDGYVRNGMVSFTRVPVDPQNIERIEVIKGPSGTLFGGYIQNIAGYGGILNRVTKRPLQTDALEVSFTSGSWELNRATVDYNKVLDNAGNTLLRFNGAIHSENSFQDQGIQRDYLIAPSLFRKVNDRLSILVQAEVYKTTRNLNFARGAGGSVTGDTWEDLRWDYYTAYSNDDMASEMNSRVFYGLVDLRISENWTSKTSVTTSAIDVNGDFFRAVMLNDTTLQRNFIQYQPRSAGSTHLQQDFIGIGKISGIENKFLLGASYVDFYDDYQRAVQPGPPFIEYDRITVGTGDDVVPVISRNAWEQFITTNKSRSRCETGFRTTAFYVSDAVKFSDGISVLGGARLDNFENDAIITNGVSNDAGYDQTTVSYKFGGVYSPFPEQVSLFGNYMNGFANQAPGINSAGELENFDAEQANQYEFGFKLNLFAGKLVSTASYYNIAITDAIRTVNDGTVTYSVQDGETSSKGFEIDLIANPVPGLNIVAGYTAGEALYEKASNPDIEGNQLTYSPERIANFWASYRVLSGPLSGIGVGLGANYVSEIFINDSNTFGAAPYTTIDGLLFYDTFDYRFSLKLNNLGDKEYYNAYGIPQKPWNVAASISVKL